MMTMMMKMTMMVVVVVIADWWAENSIPRQLLHERVHTEGSPFNDDHDDEEEDGNVDDHDGDDVFWELSLYDLLGTPPLHHPLSN